MHKQMPQSEKIDKLMLTLLADPWFQWVIKQPHKGVFPIVVGKYDDPRGHRTPYYRHNRYRIYVRDYDDWYKEGATLIVQELERRNTNDIGKFIRGRKVARFKWPSKMYYDHPLSIKAKKLARITDNNLDQADIDIIAARMLLRMKKKWDADDLYHATQEERRKTPRPKTDFARRGQGYTRWKNPISEPIMTATIPFSQSSEKQS